MGRGGVTRPIRTPDLTAWHGGIRPRPKWENTMGQKVSDHLLARLREWGVERVFGYPGDGINGLLAAWERAGDQPRFVQARHEEMAAFEAVGYAKFSGRLGVCAATSGPGAIHLLNGLYDAKLDHVPVLAIVGQTARSAMGGAYQQEVDLHTLFKDVASEFVETVTVPEQLPNVLDRAVRTAYARRAPTAVIIHADVQDLDHSPPTHAFKMVPSSLDRSSWQAVPSDESLGRAADLLNAGEKVAMLVGQGAAGARHEVAQTAEVLGGGRGQGAAGHGRPQRRAAVRHGLDRPAGHPALVRADARLRHPADDRLQLPLLAVPARIRRRAGRADRDRPAPGGPALPVRGQPHR
ncbi:hypothetical protein GCM10020000_73030 [Streptomyces olivoverticillatus]